MALLWVEGFEAFGGTASPIGSGNDISRKYTAFRVEGFGDFVTGRQGAGSVAWDTVTTSNPYIQTPALNKAGTIDTIIIGFAFYCAQLPGVDTNIIYIIGPTQDYEINVQIDASGEIVVERHGTELGRSTTAGLLATNWYYIEIKIFLDNSVGTVDVKVDETSVLSLTTQDTLYGTVADVVAVRFFGTNNAAYHFTYDDIYICDDSGTVNNAMLGDSFVKAIFPNAAGDVANWTPSAGSNYAAVDENPSDGDSTYVESDTSTNQDLYNYGSVTGFGSIHGVQINTTCRETDVDVHTLKQLCKSGTITSADSGVPVGSTTYTHRERILETDPDTSSAWSQSGVNAAQFGIEVG